jgi:peptidoglycan/xylan/chitin deacetylase (PgdA/CDA1 family)
MQGIFTISLDFELHWGVFDKRDRIERETLYHNTLKLVPQMLQLFSEHGVHVTWATVGSMFANDQQEWELMKPAVEPDYEIAKYSSYNWAKENRLQKEYRWAHFAPEVIARIEDYEGQELGTHTFSHYYCLEKQSNENAFDADLRAASQAASKFNTKPVSLVFPRNQFNEEYLRVCYANGIRAVRSNPDNWFWSPVANKTSLVRKLFRTADAYVQLGSTLTSYPLSKIKITDGEPLQLQASRFLRPWNPKYQFANKLRLRRLMQEIKTAAKRKECFHLWWHPENFGDYPEQNMESLKILLKEYNRLQNKYGMTSWNMGEFATNLLPQNNSKSPSL